MKKWLFLLVSQYVMQRITRNPSRAGIELKRMAIATALTFMALFILVILLVFRLFGWLANTFPAVGIFFNLIGLAVLLLILVGSVRVLWQLFFIKAQMHQFQNMKDGFTSSDVIDVTEVTERDSPEKK